MKPTAEMIEAAYDAWCDNKGIGRQRVEAAVTAALALVEPGEPVAYLHEIKEPNDEKRHMFSSSSENPWSHWVATYCARCEVTCTPLYASPPPPAQTDADAIIERRALINELTAALADLTALVIDTMSARDAFPHARRACDALARAKEAGYDIDAWAETLESKP